VNPRLDRLRRPNRGRREPFGKAGLIVALCAIVLATTGAAFAAGRLTGPEKAEVGKIATKTAKKFAGKTGPAGKQGPAGKPGPAGPAGATGAAGPAGTAAAYATVAPSTGGMTFKINSGFSGSPTNPSPGVTCLPAPVAGVPLALTLQVLGFINQVAPNQCGGGSVYEVATYGPGGAAENLPFNVIVP
jgi:Collagen triple helix repeat (20 copies)